jgi:hypothetical protein
MKNTNYKAHYADLFRTVFIRARTSKHSPQKSGSFSATHDNQQAN